MSFVVVDTDVASAILKGRLPDALARQLAGRQLAITFVTVGELTQWTYLHRWLPQRRTVLRAYFASVVVLTASFQAATGVPPIACGADTTARRGWARERSWC